MFPLICALFGVICVYQALDIWQTYLLFQFETFEWNPFMNYLMNRFGFFPALIGFKGFCVVLLGTLIMIYKRKVNRSWTRLGGLDVKNSTSPD